MLDAATRRLLTADEAKLIEQTSVAALDKRNLDEVGAIYDRVRKGRDKYRGLHRRQASTQVRRDHARGTGANKNMGSASKYEIFEEALGRVSNREAELAKQNAGDLKKSRLIAAAAAAEAAKTAQQRHPPRRRLRPRPLKRRYLLRPRVPRRVRHRSQRVRPPRFVHLFHGQTSPAHKHAVTGVNPTGTTP